MTGMRLFGLPVVAIAFGAFIICAETCLHVEDIVHPKSWIDLPIHDWLAGIFLVWTGIVGRRDWNKARSYLAAAWGFMTSLLFGAVVAHWEEFSPQAQGDGWVSDRAFIAILIGLLVFGLCALIGTLKRQS